MEKIKNKNKNGGREIMDGNLFQVDSNTFCVGEVSEMIMRRMGMG